MRKGLAAAFVLAAFVLLTFVFPPQALASHPVIRGPHARAHLALSPLGGQGAQSPAVYDEQLGMTFPPQAASTIAYNVTAVAQSDPQGYGPGYLVNGLSNGGYWYQVGLTYDWPYISGGYDSGFNLLYEVFGSNGTSIFPSGGGGGLEPFSGAVDVGDEVLLQLTVSGPLVTFHAHDWKTGATPSESYQAFGTSFAGLTVSADPNGFFTGLMTEWYHTGPYYGGEGEVNYTNPSERLPSAILWVDEYNANTSAFLFGDSQSFSFTNPNLLRVFSYQGATVYGDAYEFISGAQGESLITLSYGVSGGGAAYSAPVLRYEQNGVQVTAPLSDTPASYFADTGSFWQVSSSLPGSSVTERWVTPQETNGTVSKPITEAIVYFHQYPVELQYAVKGGGSGYGPPAIEAFESGSAVTVRGNASAWVDSGSLVSYPFLLPGSTPMERWASKNYTAPVGGPATRVETYYHQLGLQLLYSIRGGGSPAAPAVSGDRFGGAFSAPISNASIYFLDAGSIWSASGSLQGGDSAERWIGTGTLNGTLVQALSVDLAYIHQYSLVSGVTPPAGGSTSEASIEWVDAGKAVQISAVPSQGWRFEGWTGAGSGADSGTSNADSIVVSGPVEENATFYPGLMVSAGEGGSVTYTYTGESGTISAGGSEVIFVPAGTNVSLRASPSSFLYSFGGWGGASAGGPNATFEVVSPGALSATFSFATLVAVGAAVVAAAIAAAIVLFARARGSRRRPQPLIQPQSGP